MTTLINSNEDLNDIFKIVRSLEKSGLLIPKEQKDRFLSTLLGTLGAILLGNVLTGKGAFRAGEGTIRAGEGTIKSGQDF